VGILGDKLPKEDHANAAQAGLALARQELHSGKWHMLILDEISNAVHLGLLPVAQVLSMVDELPVHMDLILTGRDAPAEFIERADIVSEVKEVKHPYNKGQKGKRGIEW
jgi:cob(I)alamin adenosyltransferase